MCRIGDVLQPLLAEIDEFGGDRSARIPPGICGDADTPWQGETFEAGG
jgi:hypothetical protein